jgi:hypothetical protein
MTYRLPTLAAVTLIALWAPAARAEEKAEKKSSSGGVVHTVIFYLKDDAPSGTADAIVADCHEMLAKIPTVRHLKAGRPLEGAAATAKKDFAVGLVILFDDAAGLKTYIDHPLHKGFVAKHGKYINLSKLAGYDFVDGRK